ncbi:putative triacylglycerol lipase [Rosa chinensis]|uniref:Patatin n=1 Tax=Rosa chinensis TaxID=74649 RepID=A0A2P6PDF8_ROSCH|nr:patatin-like phospholipase domain-containing protein 2 [Rosa chinensis]PRQ19965.1 putative triacylglycerol lipase [Rosa chinensis]
MFRRKLTGASSSSSSPLMAPYSSLLLRPQPHPFSLSTIKPNPNPNPNLINRYTLLPLRTVNLKSSLPRSSSDPDTNRTAASSASPPPPPPPTTKKSFAVATGELFLGLATRIIKRRNGGPDRDAAASVAMFESSGKFSDERIGKVIEDELQPEVVWEQRVKDVEAEKERRVITSPGFSFSAAGLLFPYHLGAAQFLIENGYIKETTPLAGSSAGAIVCAVIASGASMAEALQATKILAEDCRNRGTAFRLGAVLRDVLQKFLPEDAHIKSNGRVRVAVTQLLWRPRGLLVDQFDSKEDLINAVFTSSFIPGYLAPRPATMFRNRLCIDGGLTLFMPPTSAAKTVRVCAFPASRLGLQGIGISPDCNPDDRATPRELFNWALEPAEDDILDRLFALGYKDAAVWAESNPVGQIVEDDSSLIGSGLA